MAISSRGEIGVGGGSRGGSMGGGRAANKAKKKEAKAVARGIKAATGKSLAPKGYKPDTEGRKSVTEKGTSYQRERYSETGNMFFPALPRKKAFEAAAKNVQSERSQAKAAGVKEKLAPKNVISKSGRKANTKGLIKKSEKKKSK